MESEQITEPHLRLFTPEKSTRSRAITLIVQQTQQAIRRFEASLEEDSSANFLIAEPETTHTPFPGAEQNTEPHLLSLEAKSTRKNEIALMARQTQQAIQQFGASMKMPGEQRNQ